jgi:hypothetical protein
MLRAVLDAKEHDWSFYTLAVIAIATSALLARAREEGKAMTTDPSGTRESPASVRPIVYGRR